MRRGLFLSGLLCLSLSGVLAARQSATGVTTKPWEKILGTWKQVPGPDEPTTLKIEPEGSGVKISYGCKQDGACTSNITTKYDANKSKYSDNPNWEASFRKTGDRTMQQDSYSNGKLSITERWQLSPDGKMLTAMYHSVNPPGAKDIIYSYDRSGEPVSNDDPFIGLWRRNWNKSDALITTFSSKGDMLTLTGTDGITIERDCDGKNHPDTTERTMVYSCHFTDPFTYDLVLTQNEKVTFSLTRKISDDGKKMVVIRKNAEGKTMPEWTFEKVQ
jgi:hypothetical protein